MFLIKNIFICLTISVLFTTVQILRAEEKLETNISQELIDDMTPKESNFEKYVFALVKIFSTYSGLSFLVEEENHALLYTLCNLYNISFKITNTRKRYLVGIVKTKAIELSQKTKFLELFPYWNETYRNETENISTTEGTTTPNVTTTESEYYDDSIETTTEVNVTIPYVYRPDVKLGFNLYSTSKEYKNPYIKYILRNIVTKVGVLLRKRYVDMTTREPEIDFNMNIAEIEPSLITLIDNYKKWSSRLPPLNLDLFKRGLTNNLHWDGLNLYPDWQSFVAYITHDAVPTPVQSDDCLVTLSRNRDNTEAYSELHKCKISEKCLDILNDGSDFGYAMTHRLLWLLAARFARGCYLISPREDQELRERFCETMYIESQYIAANEFKLPDLMFEQIALCTLDGHAHFLRNSWLENLLKLQTPDGCFKEIENFDRGPIDENDKTTTGCSEHVTSVAAASLGAAIRYIIENDIRNKTFIHY